MERRCKNCGISIDKRHSNAVRCKECQKRFRLIQKHISGSARANKRYYALYKLCKTLKKDELRFLYHKRMKDCSRADYKRLQELKTEMLIINQAVIENKYEEDYE